MKHYSPLRELAVSRLRQFHREPEVIFWVYLFPLLLIAGLGAAFTGGGEERFRVRVAAEPGEAAESLVAALARDQRFEVERTSPGQIDAAGSGGEWDLTVVPRGEGVEYRFDPLRPESRLARERVDRALQEARGRRDAFPVETTEVVTPGSRYIDWVIPGLLGLNIMGSSLWGVGFAAVDLRMRKVLKRLSATPMRRSHFLLSLVLARLLFLAAEVTAVVLFGRFVFGMPVAGDLLSLAALSLLGAMAFVSISLLTAVRAQKIETISGLMNVVQVPMWLFSGVFFSAERFPAAAQPFIQALPLTQLNHALRGNILHGRSIWDEGVAVAWLSAYAVVCFALAMRWFRWR